MNSQHIDKQVDMLIRNLENENEISSQAGKFLELRILGAHEGVGKEASTRTVVGA